MIKIIKNIHSLLIRFLDEYSPIALAVIVLPFFIPVERELTRRLLLLFCAAPGLLAALLNPKAVFKNPVLLLVILFTGYFSAQHLWGMRPLDAHILRMSATTAIQIIGPALILSLITPRRKLYPAAIALILLTATIHIGWELIGFYSKSPFPLARFGGLGHPVTASKLTGLLAVLTGAFFIQNGPRLTRRDILPLICLPLLLGATLLTHTRSAAVAMQICVMLTLIGIKPRIKKTTILFAVVALTFGLYAALTLSAPKPTPKKRTVDSAMQETLAILKAPAQTVEEFPDAPPRKKKRRRGYSLRGGGVLATSKGAQLCAAARLHIWRDHFSRMDTPKKWLIGHGLGMNAFAKHPHAKATRWYRWTPLGYQLHPHSGYVWALYHGGVIGLGLLLLLLATATWRALRAGAAGAVPLALIAFSSITMLINGQRLLVGNGTTYLAFWIPLALAAGLPRKKDSIPE